MARKFIVTPKDMERKIDKSIIMTIRIDREVQKKYDQLAGKSNRSRNELIGMALKYALENLEFITDELDQKPEADA